MASGKIVGVALFVVLGAVVAGGVWMISRGPEEPVDTSTDDPDSGTEPNGATDLTPDADDPSKRSRPPIEVVPEVVVERKLPPVELKEPVEVSDSPEFTFDGYGSALNNIPWNEVAHIAFRLNRDLKEMYLAWMRIESPPEKVFVQIDADTIRLAHILAPWAVQFDSLSGLGAVGHPSVGANLFAKTLEASGVPLDAQQKEKLVELSKRYIAEDAERRKTIPDGAIWMRRAASELRFRLRYVDDVRALLTDRQRAATGDGTLAHRTGLDPFSPTMLFRERAQPLDCAGNDVELNMATDFVCGAMGMAAARHREAVYEVVEGWVADLPKAATSYRPSEASQMGALDRERLLLAVEVTADLYERVLDKVDMPQSSSMMLSTMDRILHPHYVEFR